MIEGKVFLKLDASNLSAWEVRKTQLGSHLRNLVHSDDHAFVFSNESQELSFSDPWQKYKDGQLSKNVMNLPCKASLAYVDRYKEKFATPGFQLPPILKKRAHSTVSSDSPSTFATAATVSSTSSATSTQSFAVKNSVNASVIDLTENQYATISSPNHKVHVVEQRAYQEQASPMSSMASSASPVPTATSPKTARMRQLEFKVESHDKKLTDIQTSVTVLDDKIVTQGEKTSFQFTRFEEMLSHITGTIVDGMQKMADPKTAPKTDTPMNNSLVTTEEFGLYDPIRRAAEWNETRRRDQTHRLYVATQRAEYISQLRRDTQASSGDSVDFEAIADQRYPYPPEIDYPDDIQYDDDL
eukprot:CAMPEP_0172417124 /NCGR_PEP_ID=MMETSP1064-20121228/3636_1 /TAXON_ID=202472 /ORGANISM="Aulacoseira subarctica , Strain CCAP 1002/5" /LENGTH=355 /DNA_ID=CAMNT_0013155243 /DNA_START=756 /DNA_END=1823 /DNA_ORIENTATION=-